MNDNGDKDIYNDLPEFRFDETLDKLHATISKLEAENGELLRKLDLMKKEKETLESNCKILSTNLSSLLKTARLEVSRKDRTIIDLRKKISDVSPYSAGRFGAKRKHSIHLDVSPRKRLRRDTDRSSRSQKSRFNVKDVTEVSTRSSLSSKGFEKPVETDEPSRTPFYCKPNDNSSSKSYSALPPNAIKPSNIAPTPVLNPSINEAEDSGCKLDNGVENRLKEDDVVEAETCRPLPLDCPTVFSARMYRRIYNCSIQEAPNPTMEICRISDYRIPTAEQEKKSAELLSAESPATLKIGLTQQNDVLSGSAVKVPTDSQKGQTCAEKSDNNIGVVQNSILSNVISDGVENLVSINKPPSVRSSVTEPEKSIENTSNAQNISQTGKTKALIEKPPIAETPGIPIALEDSDVRRSIVKGDLCLSDSDSSSSDSKLESRDVEKLISESHRPLENNENRPTTELKTHPDVSKVTHKPENAILQKFARPNWKISPRGNVNSSIGSGCKKTAPPRAVTNSKLRFTPISSSWVQSMRSKQEAPNKEQNGPDDNKLEKVNEPPSISITSELMVKIDDPKAAAISDAMLVFGSPVKWAEDSSDSIRKDDTEPSSRKMMWSLFGSPLKTLDGGSSDIPSFTVPQTAYEDSCLTSHSVLKDARPTKPLTASEPIPAASEDKSNISKSSPVPSAKAKSMFSPLKDSKSSFHTVTNNVLDQGESLLGLCFGLKPPSKYGDSLLGHYDDTAQFVSALARDESKLSPMSTPTKSSDVNGMQNSEKTIPSSFKEIFVDKHQQNDVWQSFTSTTINEGKSQPGLACNTLNENPPIGIVSEPAKSQIGENTDAIKNRSAVTSSDNSSCKSVSSLSSTLPLKLIKPSNIASSTVLSPSTEPSTVKCNILQPRKTPRIIPKQNSRPCNKEIEPPKLALNDDFLTQQEKRWRNSPTNYKKSIVRNSAVVSLPLPKKENQTSTIASKNSIGKLSSASLKVPDLLDSVKVSSSAGHENKNAIGEPVSKMAVEESIVDSVLDKMETGCELSPKEDDTPENQVALSSAPSDKLQSAPPQKVCMVQTCEKQSTSPVQMDDLEEEVVPLLKPHEEHSGAIHASSALHLILSVAKENAAKFLPSPPAETLDKTGSDAKRVMSDADVLPVKKTRGRPRYSKRVLTNTKCSEVVSEVNIAQVRKCSKEGLNTPAESFLRKSGRIVIEKNVQRHSDFIKSSALKWDLRPRSGKTFSVKPVRGKKDRPIKPGKKLPIEPYKITTNKSDSEVIGDKSKSGDSTKASFESTFSKRNEPDCGFNSSQCNSSLKLAGNTSSYISSSKSPFLRRKSESNLQSSSSKIYDPFESINNSDVLKMQSKMSLRRRSASSFGSVTKNLEHSSYSVPEDPTKHSACHRPWVVQQVDLRAEGNIYDCLSSNMFPDDPRACQDLIKSRKKVIHTCGIDWDPKIWTSVVPSSALNAKDPEKFDPDVSAISPVRKENASMNPIAPATSTPFTRSNSQRILKCTKTILRRAIGFPSSPDTGEPLASIPVLPNVANPRRRMTTNLRQRTILANYSSKASYNTSPTRKSISPTPSSSPKENLVHPWAPEIKKARRNLEQSKKSPKNSTGKIGSPEIIKIPKNAAGNVPDNESTPEPVKTAESPVDSRTPPKAPIVISIKRRKANFSSSSPASCTKVIYAGKRTASFKASD